MKRGGETVPPQPPFFVMVPCTVPFLWQHASSAVSLSLVVQDLLKKAGRSYIANQQALFFIAFLLSHSLYAFNFDCLNGT